MKFKDLKNSDGKPYGDLTGQTYNGSILLYRTDNEITSLEGCPKIVTGDFKMSRLNNLTSLEGCPEEVRGEFEISNCEKITSLTHAPKVVKGNYSLVSSPITSLKGCPDTIEQTFKCFAIPITSLDYSPKVVEWDYVCTDTNITSFKGISKVKGGLTFYGNDYLESLEGCPEEVGNDFWITDVPKLESYKFAPKKINGTFRCSSNSNFKADDEILKHQIIAKSYLIDGSRTDYDNMERRLEKYKANLSVKSKGFRTLLGLD